MGNVKDASKKSEKNRARCDDRAIHRRVTIAGSTETPWPKRRSIRSRPSPLWPSPVRLCWLATRRKRENLDNCYCARHSSAAAAALSSTTNLDYFSRSEISEKSHRKLWNSAMISRVTRPKFAQLLPKVSVWLFAASTGFCVRGSLFQPMASNSCRELYLQLRISNSTRHTYVKLPYRAGHWSRDPCRGGTRPLQFPSGASISYWFQESLSPLAIWSNGMEAKQRQARPCLRQPVDLP